MKNRIPLIAAALCMAGALQAQAQTPPAMPAMKGEGAFRWICGGIGSDESTAFRAAMKSHPLSLLFARQDGAYVADVDVAIQREGGAPGFTLRATGPVCLVDVPAGRYTVQATAQGTTQKQPVTVGDTPKTADFRF
ncbi:carboxypeptidase regulatory-like domain-containing protein [Variovorax sp. PAMC 28711]|uniref:carboxypeptidase regulatory-like domain-containing protein n=1 Tax=Variovorax sp. PAMC 28711 TaxID=1795631 RepID=UPI00078D8155|nr:carboxypeptidase regulatory-like domain-containing protein [Variovorax sp. PAMC 28711]AMM24558.1 hypothetical protein AX767_09505 [Variovorax sp. PAMC 28711]